MQQELSFLTALALAGIAALVGHVLADRIPVLQRIFVPKPIMGGFIFAIGRALASLWGVDLRLPVQGYSVDFLVALLTSNMGMHITPRILRNGWPLFLIFLGAGLVLYFVQLSFALCVAFWGGEPLHTAIVAGPLSFLGAPFNLNPPSQTDALKPAFHGIYSDLKSTAQGVMMLGVVISIFGAGILGRYLFARAGKQPPNRSPSETHSKLSLAKFAVHITVVLVLILVVVAAAFGTQNLLLRKFPALTTDIIPVIVISYFFGAILRLAIEKCLGQQRFPEQALTVLLLGPTMNLVFAYAAMGLPLLLMMTLTTRLVCGGILAIGGSLMVARLIFPLLERFTDRYYAAVVATAFFAITTGWGPVGMGFLRRFTDEKGEVEPMPVVMPLNAFYLFPWMVILLTQIVLWISG